MEPQGGGTALARIEELEQQLQQSHAKLQKAENAKKKLREHVVLLKEKAINSLALVEEHLKLQQQHVQLQQQYSEASAAAAELQQQAQQALDQQAAAEAALQRAESHSNAVLKDKLQTEKQLQAAERKLSTAVKAAEQARMEQQAAQARMDALQQELQDVKQAVQQLQQHKGQQQQQHQHQPLLLQQNTQHQLSCKVQQLEARVRSLQEADVEIDVCDLYRDLQRSVLDVLTAKIDGRLEGLQHTLLQLQTQHVRSPTAAAPAGGSTCSSNRIVERPASQVELQQLQQQVEVLAAQQQQWNSLLRRALSDSNALTAAAAAAGDMCGQQHEPDESCCNRSSHQNMTAASRGPTREPSPAAPDTAAAAKAKQTHNAQLRAALVAAAAIRVTGSRGRQMRLAGVCNTQPGAAATAAVAGAASSRVLCSSSMFGTTELHLGGTTSSYGEEQQYNAASEMRPAQAASPSIGTHMLVPETANHQQQQQQQQQQLVGRKRPRQQVAVEEQHEQEADAEDEQTDDPWDQFCELSSMQLPNALQGQQQQAKCSTARSECGVSSAASVRAADMPRAKQPKGMSPVLQQAKRPAQDQQQQQDAMQPQRALLASHLKAVREQQGSAAPVAEQLAAAVLASEVSVVCLEDAFLECFLQDAAPAYDVRQLQCVLTSLEQQQQQQQQGRPGQICGSSDGALQEQLQQLQQQLYCAGWAGVAPAVLAAHQRLAECACRLSGLLQQQQQQQQGTAVIGCSTSRHSSSSQQGSRPWQWPAAAECWQVACAAAGAGAGAGTRESSAGGTAAAAAAVAAGSADRQHMHASSAHLLGDSRDSPEFVQRLAGKLSSVCSAHAALHATAGAAQAYDHQHQQQQQQNAARACAASAAAGQLLKAAGDVHCYQQLLASLLGMAAEHTQQPAAHTLNIGPAVADHTAAAAAAAADNEAAGFAVSSVGGVVTAAESHPELAMACLLAAVSSWPEALRLIPAAAAGLHDAVDHIKGQEQQQQQQRLQLQVVPEPGSFCNACSWGWGECAGSGSQGNSSSSSCCWVWQCLVTDPVLLAIRSCLQDVAASGARAAAPQLQQPAAAAVAAEQKAVGEALQVVLKLIAAAEGGFGGQAQCHGVAACAGASAVKLPTPQELLAQLLGMVQLLLQKQHAGLPSGGLTAGYAAVSAAAAGLYVAIGLVVQLVPREAAQRSVWALKAAMAGVQLSGAPAVFQKLLRQA